IALLIGVLVFGVTQRGSHSWFRFGIFSFQPSEICRIATILISAAFLERNKQTIKEFKTLFWLGIILLPIFALIMLQPDFSSIVVSAPALVVLLFAAGVNLYYFGLILAFGVAAGFFPIAWTYLGLNPDIAQNSFLAQMILNLRDNLWYILGFSVLVFFICWLFKQLFRQFRIELPSLLVFIVAGAILAGFFSGLFVEKKMKPYQRKRVEAFLAPKSDPKGASYNILQAQIAMGSGGVFGKGLFSGTQSRLGFVPERHTDFILAVLGEETGLVGTLGVLFLYLLLLWRTTITATLSSDLYGYFVCMGIFGIFFTYLIINFGMLIGLVPVAGIPLPFISYGGSNLVASMWAFGIVESVYRRRLTMV
ncbi:MAG: FtsW/RodA/SpoVE family cell cycle protein, partial [Elusimicrobiaceae bacterium]|nr:FtsW/RodA/SpoVE family cell cycle protein [Elusimicrobiaceae bacterium]